MAQRNEIYFYTTGLPENEREGFYKWFKQQIKDAYNQGYREGETSVLNEYGFDISEFDDAENYFNDNFK